MGPTAFLAMGLGLGCAPSASEAVLATEVVHAPGHLGEGQRDVDLAVNGVRGGGSHAGSFDVFSLGVQVGIDDVLVLGFHGERAQNVPGPDLAIFENPFDVADGGRFMDPVVVEVSPDCDRYAVLPHRYQGPDPEAFSEDPQDWVGFGGITPVQLHREGFRVDPFAPIAGGDRLDFDTLDPDDPVAAEIGSDGAACVRLSAASLWISEDSGVPYPRHPVGNGPDIDGVYAASLR